MLACTRVQKQKHDADIRRLYSIDQQVYTWAADMLSLNICPCKVPLRTAAVKGETRANDSKPGL